MAEREKGHRTGSSGNNGDGGFRSRNRLACRPGAAMVIVPPSLISLSPEVTTYWFVSPAKVITSPATTVPVPPVDFRVMVVAPIA